MKRIKLSFPYPSFPVERQLPQSGLSEKIQFDINNENNEEECDFWVVFNNLNGSSENAYCNPKNTLLVIGEPPTVDNFDKKFVNQFHHVISCDYKLEHSGLHSLPLCLPWFINKSFDSLVKNDFFLKREDKISVICSKKARTEGHKKRLAFVIKLKDKFKDKIDLFGKGFNEIDDKWDGLAPYQFSVAVENSNFQSYFTEKITDCFLSEAVPIYHGCQNIEDFFDKNSFLKIDINDFNLSANVIEKIIDKEIKYEDMYSSLMQSKKLSLYKYNLFFFLNDFVYHNYVMGRKKDVKLYNRVSASLRDKVKEKIKRIF